MKGSTLVTDEAPVIEQTPAVESGGTPPQRRATSRLKLFAAGGLLLLLIVLLYVGFVYITTRKPLTAMPLVSSVARKTPPHYLFSMYGATSPVGVALSPDGRRLYVAETGDQRRVRVYDRNAVLQTDLVPPLNPVFQRQPVQVAVSFAGQVYVSDSILRNVRIYGPDDSYVGELPKPDKLSDSDYVPFGVAIDRRGQLLVTSSSPGQSAHVVVFDPQGQLKLSFGEAGSAPGQLDGANQAITDDAGRIFVANSLNSRVEVFGPDGAPQPEYMLGKSQTPLGLPIAVTVDDQSRLYVVDAVNHDVAVYDISGERAEFLFKFGDHGTGDGQFRYPMSIAVDNTGRVYVSDKDNNRVQVWEY